MRGGGQSSSSIEESEHPLDPRPVCKLEFVHYGPREKKTERSICFGLVVLRIFIKIPEVSKNSQGMSLRARGLKFWNLALHIRI